MGTRITRFTKKHMPNSLAERARKFLRDTLIAIAFVILAVFTRITDYLLHLDQTAFYIGSAFYLIAIMLGFIAAYRAIWLAELTIDESNNRHQGNTSRTPGELI